MLLEKDIALKFSSVIASSYYKEWLDYFEEVLDVTRQAEYRNNKDFIFNIQIKLAKIETSLWKLLKKGRMLAKKLNEKINLTPQEIKKLKSYEDTIFINRQLIRISRTICDGIAWRSLKYNRPYITTAARGDSAGSVDIDDPGFREEIEWARIISKDLNSIVIINDLTHFLRIGDLTQVSREGIFGHEIKLGKSPRNKFTLATKPKHAAVSDQGRRLLELQDLADSGVAHIDGGIARIVPLRTRLKTNLKLLAELIERSEKEYVVAQAITPYLSVEVGRDKVSFEELKSKFPKDRFPLEYTNWDSFHTDVRGNFMRAMIPYSIFPLAASQCMKLMSGQVFAKVGLDYNKLKVVLEERGWEVEVVTEEMLDKQLDFFTKAKENMFPKKGSLFEILPEESGVLKIKKGPFSLNITAPLIARLTTEFMDPDTFLDMLDEHYTLTLNNPSLRNNYLFPVFQNEVEIWN